MLLSSLSSGRDWHKALPAPSNPSRGAWPPRGAIPADNYQQLSARRRHAASESAASSASFPHRWAAEQLQSESMLQTPPQATKAIGASVQEVGIRQGTACGIPRRGTEQCPGGDISPGTAAPGSFARATGDGNGLDLQHLPLLIGGFSEPIRLQNINASNRQPHIPVLGPESFWAPSAPQLPPPCTCIGLHPPVSFHLAPAPKHPTVASTCVMSSLSSPRNFQQP